MPSLKLMTWNVLYSEKADNILKLIAKVKPDIICCQEITTNSHINRDRNVPEELGHLLNGQYVYQEVLTAMENHPGSLGNAIISKFPIISSRQAFIQRGDSDIDYSKQNRGYVEARIQLDNQRVITIGTTHQIGRAHV